MFARLERQLLATYSHRTAMTGRLHDADYLRRLEDHLVGSASIERNQSFAVLTAAVSTISAWLIFVATVSVLAAELSSARLVLLGFWAVLSIGTVLRPTVRSSGWPLARSLLAVWASMTGIGFASFVGTDLLLPFVGMVGLLGSVRLAGNDASKGIERAPGYYLRRCLSPAGLAAFAFLVGFVALNSIVWSSLLGPLLNAGTPVLQWPDGSQTWQLIVAVLFFTPMVLLVCELVAAVGRTETRLFGQLSEALRTKERDRVAQDLHDRALSLLSAARLYPRDHPGHDRALDQLEMNLRSMQFEYELEAGHLTLDRCCRRSRALADLGGVDLVVSATDSELALAMDRPMAMLFDQILHNLVANSVGAGATEASVQLSIAEGRLRGSFTDNAGGFDPRPALQRGGGLSRLRHALDLVGGSFAIDPGGVATRFELPTCLSKVDA